MEKDKEVRGNSEARGIRERTVPKWRGSRISRPLKFVGSKLPTVDQGPLASLHQKVSGEENERIGQESYKSRRKRTGKRPAWSSCCTSAEFSRTSCHDHYAYNWVIIMHTIVVFSRRPIFRSKFDPRIIVNDRSDLGPFLNLLSMENVNVIYLFTIRLRSWIAFVPVDSSSPSLHRKEKHPQPGCTLREPNTRDPSKKIQKELWGL